MDKAGDCESVDKSVEKSGFGFVDCSVDKSACGYVDGSVDNSLDFSSWSGLTEQMTSAADSPHWMTSSFLAPLKDLKVAR